MSRDDSLPTSPSSGRPAAPPASAGHPPLEPGNEYVVSGSRHKQASRSLAGGVSSNFRLSPLSVPLSFERAQGAYLYDADGNAYVDYVLGMGPALLGHAPAEVTAAVAATLEEGQLFAGQHHRETALAELLVELVPSADLVRFGLTGSEMVQLALRVARAASGRQKVVKFEGHYHGWFDTILVSTAPPADALDRPQLPSIGQSQAASSDVVILPWNDLAALQSCLSGIGEQVAALIMEPVLCNTCVVVPRAGYLEGVRRLCAEYGIALIFDEVITGFRLGLEGAQGLVGVQPDLTVFGKSLGGGFPVAALAGRGELMELVGNGRVLHGGTYNTNLVSTAAALAVLQILRRDEASLYPGLEARGTRLIAGLRELAEAAGVELHVQGLPAVFNTSFVETGNVADYRDYLSNDSSRQQAFLRALQGRGVRVTSRGTWFLSTAHREPEIERTLEAVETALREL